MNGLEQLPVGAALTRWIRDARPSLPRDFNPFQPHGVLAEQEPDAAGVLQSALVVFLVNRECPWTCLECDLWKFTTKTRLPAGAIPRQIQSAFRSMQSSARPSWLKLYNSGSFFDPGAIPVDDHAAIAVMASEFERLVVECHPSLIGDRCWRFRDRLSSRLEVAMGLESVHPAALSRLNKRMTPEDFARAAAQLRRHDVDVRAFLLIQPPGMPGVDVVDWTVQGAVFAAQAGAGVVSLIPTRSGNGALDRLQTARQFASPSLRVVEQAFERSLAAVATRARVFLDTWDWSRLARCGVCAQARLERVEAMNRIQRLLPRIDCACDIAEESRADTT